jgi:CDP-diacylglycerol--serine O-phosphatidyltransferase
MKRFFPVLQYVNIPNLLTTLGLCVGIAAFHFLRRHDLMGVFICLFTASFIDVIDGFIASKLNQQTRFGTYADSLVDFFICCVMPAAAAYVIIGQSVWLLCGVGFYCVCGLWRLANYNIVAAEKTSHFTGLPVPGAMLLVSMAMWGVVRYGAPAWVSVTAFFAVGLLMVSAFKLAKYGIAQKAMWLIWLGFTALIFI